METKTQQDLLAERQSARLKGDYQLADEIRATIEHRFDVVVEDLQVVLENGEKRIESTCIPRNQHVQQKLDKTNDKRNFSTKK